MSYHVYTTDGWILSSSDLGEANRYLEIFTKDLGLIHAHAQGVRYLKSKQRYNLQNFSSVKVALVRGRDIWRLTSASAIISPSSLMTNREKFQLAGRVFSLIKRLIKGEEKDDNLYNELDSGVTFLLQNSFSAESLKNFEAVWVLRILSRLGYIADNKELGELSLSGWDSGSISFDDSFRRRAVCQINLALANSQL